VEVNREIGIKVIRVWNLINELLGHELRCSVMVWTLGIVPKVVGSKPG
jgi:hypothetical protein